ncbi:hypothetical protein [Aquimarina agarivorans]|uniref:hypothetical protein n=1 Tax=Aquimarina agarivorans TaxID=980584 RepID=UPI000248FD20|nr:hypothetical protein [Aquimarina agarivorans]
MGKSKIAEKSFFINFFSITLQRALMCGIFFTDTYFLSFSSDEAVSGVGAAVIFLVSLLSMITVIAMVGVSFLSIASGEKNYEKFITISGVLIWLSIAMAVVFTLLQYFLSLKISNWAGLTTKASGAFFKLFILYASYLYYRCSLFKFFGNSVGKKK